MTELIRRKQPGEAWETAADGGGSQLGLTLFAAANPLDGDAGHCERRHHISRSSVGDIIYQRCGELADARGACRGLRDGAVGGYDRESL